MGVSGSGPSGIPGPSFRAEQSRCPAQTVRPPAEKILLLLPVCTSCASARTCSTPSGCMTRSLLGSNGDKAPEPLRGAAVPKASRCICTSCSSSLLLLVLLRLGFHRLKASLGDGILFCGNDDVPARQKDFFPLLLCPDDQSPWCRSNLGKTGTQADGAEQGISLSTRKENYYILSRIAYKLLPGPRDYRANLFDANAKYSMASSQLPALLRFMAELPDALKKPPALLLFLQPSRWLNRGGQYLCTGAAVLQSCTDRKSYGLFLALLLRAATACDQISSSALGGKSTSVTGSLGSAELSDPDGQQHLVAGCSVVAECFLCCPDCCWLCSRHLAATPSGHVPLCCLEQSEWLGMLRSRYSQVFLLFNGSCDSPSTQKKTADAASTLSGRPTGYRGPELFVADITDVACGTSL